MGTVTRGTTPSIRFTFKVVDVAVIVSAYLTINQDDKTILEKNIDSANIGGNYLEWELNQEDTLAMRGEKIVSVQCRWRLADGTAGASGIYLVTVRSILKNGVI